MIDLASDRDLIPNIDEEGCNLIQRDFTITILIKKLLKNQVDTFSVDFLIRIFYVVIFNKFFEVVSAFRGRNVIAFFLDEVSPESPCRL